MPGPNRIERFDPEGKKSPNGEWRSEEKPGMLDRIQATGLSVEAACRGVEAAASGGAKGRTGRKTRQQGFEVAGREL